MWLYELKAFLVFSLVDGVGEEGLREGRWCNLLEKEEEEEEGGWWGVKGMGRLVFPFFCHFNGQTGVISSCSEAEETGAWSLKGKIL